MDPFTDMLDAWARNRIGFQDLVAWLKEWASEGAQASALCRPVEWGTLACNVAIDNAYHLGYMLQILTQ